MNWRDHDFEIFLAGLYIALKIGAFFVTADDEYMYATLHGHSDDVLGALLMMIGVRYFNERTSD